MSNKNEKHEAVIPVPEKITETVHDKKTEGNRASESDTMDTTPEVVAAPNKKK